MINQRTRTGVSLRTWVARKKQRTQTRLGKLIPAGTPERELWAANLTGRMTILSELEQRLEAEDDRPE